MGPSLTLALALATGMVVQVLARHLRQPGIVLLLAAGAALGPDGLGLIHPTTLGRGLYILVGFAVAVILFEGGLNLDFRRLRRAQRPIRRLVTVGALVTALGGTLAARLLMGWGWQMAALFGVLVIVTGPTVVTPLLRRIKVHRSVATVLEAEGVLIDAVGAVLAAFAIEVALSPTGETLLRRATILAGQVGLGVLSGAVVGLALALLLRRQGAVPDGLENTFVLGMVLALYQGANALLHESGIVAVTVAGLIVGNAKTHVHRDLLEFKEQLTLMLIGALFVLLAADVRLSEVRALGGAGLTTVALLVAVVRPLTVLVCTWGSRLTVKQRMFVGWIGPRGIIAAAVSSLFAAELDRRGLPGGNELRAMVFMVIALTVVLAGTTGGLVARLLGLRQQPSGWVIVGAHALARALARTLRDCGAPVMCVDSNPKSCNIAEREHLRVIHGNALADRTLERARIDTRLGAVALSANEEVNLLFLQRVRRQTGIRQLYAALREAEHGVTRAMLGRAGAEMVFGGTTDVDLWSLRLRRNLALVQCFELVASPEGGGAPLQISPQSDRLPLVMQRGESVCPVGEQTRVEPRDRVWFVLFRERLAEARVALAQQGWRPLEPTPRDEAREEALRRKDSGIWWEIKP